MREGMLSKGRSHPMERWGKFLLALGGLGTVVTPVVALNNRRSLEEPIVLAAVGAWMLLCLLGVFLQLRGRWRGASQVMTRAGRICPRCRYPLPGEPQGVCPECGDPFTHDDNLIAWRARYPWLPL